MSRSVPSADVGPDSFGIGPPGTEVLVRRSRVAAAPLPAALADDGSD
jgi:hypothetical protein